MGAPIDLTFLGQPDKVNPDIDNAHEGPHIDVIHKLSDTDAIKTRIGLDGSVLSQDILQNDPAIRPPPDPGILKTLPQNNLPASADNARSRQGCHHPPRELTQHANHA